MKESAVIIFILAAAGALGLNILFFSVAMGLIREPSDVSVLIGFTIIPLTLLGNYFLFTRLYKQLTK